MKESFHWADYTIFAAFLVLFTLIGVVVSWLDRKKTSAKYFLTGGGQSHWIMVGFSMQASFVSAILILSGPGEIYNYGTHYSYYAVAVLLVLPLATRFYLPIFYKLNLISAYEYLEMRFNKATKLLASVSFCIQMILYLSVVLYAPALALSQATGFPILWSILFCGGVCTTYTCLGGMKATIMNDTIQMLIIYVGLIVVVVKGVIEVGGISEVLRRSQDGGRIIINEFRPDPTLRTTFWTQILGGSVLALSPYATNQTILQKFIGSKSMSLAKRSLILSMVSTIVITVVITILGLVTFAFYHDCDPMNDGKITKIDQIVPLFVNQLMFNIPGLPGLFMASTFSAALSSMSGSLNSLSAILLTDFILPIYNAKIKIMSEKLKMYLSRIFVLMFGLLSTFLGLQAHHLGESVLQLTLIVFSATGGPMLGLVTLGMFFSFVNNKGATVGFVIGYLVTGAIAFGALFYDVHYPVLPGRVDGCIDHNITNIGNQWLTSQAANVTDQLSSVFETSTAEMKSQEPMFLFRITFQYYGVIGFLITFIIGIIVSLMTGKNKGVDSELLYNGKKNSNVEMEEKSFLEKTQELQKCIILENSSNLNKNGDVLGLNETECT